MPDQPELTAEAAARTQAITWVLHQVSRAAVVSCDPRYARIWSADGFPSSNLLTLGPASNDPLGSDLVVATAAVRAQFGSRLATVYAPAVIASFGSGNARIDIRWVYSGGAAAVPRRPEKRRCASGRLPAPSCWPTARSRLSATARAQLLSGEIDPRLPLLLAIMAESHPVRIVDFVDQSPGGGPASLLRSVDLATADSAAHLTRAAYLGWMQSFIDGEPGPVPPRIRANRSRCLLAKPW